MYVSTKDITSRRSLVRKLAPKFMGLEKDFNNSNSHEFNPTELKQRGIHLRFMLVIRHFRLVPNILVRRLEPIWKSVESPITGVMAHKTDLHVE